MSHRELFWVIKNGIRLSGMPGESGEQISALPSYAWSLGESSKR
jgi:hypothetical protein